MLRNRHKVCAPSHLVRPPRGLKFYGLSEVWAVGTLFCVKMNLGLYNGLLMSSDMSSYPLQVAQGVCKTLTWINQSRTRKDLQGKQRLALDMYMQFRQETLKITRGGQDLCLI